MFKQNFHINDIYKGIDNTVVDAEQQIKDGFIRVGRSTVEYALQNKEYIDRTFNLKSSTGFALYLDGFLQHEEYDGTPDGQQDGQRLANEVASGTKGYYLVVTAGMYYGVYVESKGYDVLTLAASFGDKNILKMAKSIKLNTRYDRY